MELEVRGNEGGGELSVGRSSSASTPYLRGDVVQFLAVLACIISRTRAFLVNMSWCVRASTHLVCNYRPTRGSCIGSNDHSAIKQSTDNCCTGRCCFGERHALRVEREISVVVAKVEAWHFAVLMQF